ncbi:peptidoglycan branched peptide synthesis protein [Streptococcus penaeicida]|uniref:Peptidoglycan branched peptide synthesis protein n=1 Tax=Streptococcus penaeicida TaxID=1765960 RepID=A0A2N8LCR5_9STRE|nr:peptidoglycan bridge formation glycyltransferase FemA/FemB family protein [Streptococcus penaeicida]PND47955.1 peptidoglycan branched peptide synthesis protein [Streptococcus penaeicida]
MLTISSVSKEDFLFWQEKIATANFLQSNEIFELQTERQNFLDTQRLAFLKDGQIVGLAIVNYRKKWRFFKEALLVQGPILDYSDPQLLDQALLVLESNVKKQGAIRLICHPYLIAEFEGVANPSSIFRKNGYLNYYDSNFLLNGMVQAFIKDLRLFKDVKAIEESYPPVLKRNIKKYKESHVNVRDLNRDEIPLFYDILLATSDRRDFAVPDIDFFYKLKDKFGNRTLFMYASLDCREYIAYLDQNIVSLEDQIDLLGQKADSKKRNMAIKNAEQELKSYLKRLKDFEELDIKSNFLPLSSYLFIAYGNEVLSYYGGNLPQYYIYGGATLINAEMIAYTKNQGYDFFDFGGTIEVEDSQYGKGNFNFKKQFGGQLIHSYGSFIKPLNVIGKICQKIAKEN